MVPGERGWRGSGDCVVDVNSVVVGGLVGELIGGRKGRRGKECHIRLGTNYDPMVTGERETQFFGVWTGTHRGAVL